MSKEVGTSHSQKWGMRAPRLHRRPRDRHHRPHGSMAHRYLVPFDETWAAHLLAERLPPKGLDDSGPVELAGVRILVETNDLSASQDRRKGPAPTQKDFRRSRSKRRRSLDEIRRWDKYADTWLRGADNKENVPPPV